MLTTAGADVLDDELPIGSADEAFDDDLMLADDQLSARLGHIVHNLLTSVDGLRRAERQGRQAA